MKYFQSFTNLLKPGPRLDYSRIQMTPPSSGIKGSRFLPSALMKRCSPEMKKCDNFSLEAKKQMDPNPAELDQNNLGRQP